VVSRLDCRTPLKVNDFHRISAMWTSSIEMLACCRPFIMTSTALDKLFFDYLRHLNTMLKPSVGNLSSIRSFFVSPYKSIYGKLRKLQLLV
jgi:hypothetical protein